MGVYGAVLFSGSSAVDRSQHRDRNSACLRTLAQRGHAILDVVPCPGVDPWSYGTHQPFLYDRKNNRQSGIGQSIVDFRNNLLTGHGVTFGAGLNVVFG